jgi:hypothetical protein
MKIPAFFAAAAQKRNRLRILPQHSPGFAIGFDFIDDGGEINRNEFFHNASRRFHYIKAVGFHRQKDSRCPFSSELFSQSLGAAHQSVAGKEDVPPAVPH